MSPSARRPPRRPPAEPAPSTPGPRTWQGITYRPSQAGAPAVRRLFQFAGAFAPDPTPEELAWEATVDERVLGGVLVERRGEQGLIHGPVVVDPPAPSEPLEVAAQLVAVLIEAGRAGHMDTLFARPQGLDRVWVRLGFVPMPENSLPPGLRGRPGTGLHAWRRPGSYEIALPAEDRGRRGRG